MHLGKLDTPEWFRVRSELEKAAKPVPRFCGFGEKSWVE